MNKYMKVKYHYRSMNLTSKALTSPIDESPNRETESEVGKTQDASERGVQVTSQKDLEVTERSAHDLDVGERSSLLRKKGRSTSRNEDMIVSCYQEDPYIGESTFFTLTFSPKYFIFYLCYVLLFRSRRKFIINTIMI